MKKILLIAACIFAMSAQAQTVKKDTTTGVVYAKIQSVKVMDLTATRLSITLVNDNLDPVAGTAKFYYELLTNAGDRVYRGNVVITGEDYTSWNANSIDATYGIVADKLKLTIVE